MLCLFCSPSMILIVDGVPKEGLRIQDVLIRIAVLLLIRDKVSLQVEILGSLTVLFTLCIWSPLSSLPPFGPAFQRSQSRKGMAWVLSLCVFSLCMCYDKNKGIIIPKQVTSTGQMIQLFNVFYLFLGMIGKVCIREPRQPPLHRWHYGALPRPEERKILETRAWFVVTSCGIEVCLLITICHITFIC